MIGKLILASSIALIFSLAPGAAGAQEMAEENSTLGCAESGAVTQGKFVSDLCYECMFPIRLAGMGGNSKTMPEDTAAMVCVCPGRMGYPTPGLTFGMWKPTHFVETVRAPGCFAALDQKTNLGSLGRGGGGADNKEAGYYSAHFYTFPTGAILDMVTSSFCSGGGGGFDMDMVYMTEIDPTHSDPWLSMTMNPESALFTNEVARASCMVDAVAASTVKPINALFWCLGSWGQTYPLTGYGNARSGVQDASLGAARTLAIQHKRFMMPKTYGNTAVCASHPYLLYPKQQYKWQVLHPLPQRESSDWTGKATMLSREFRQIPITGEDWVQVLFTYEECCINF